MIGELYFLIPNIHPKPQDPLVHWKAILISKKDTLDTTVIIKLFENAMGVVSIKATQHIFTEGGLYAGNVMHIVSSIMQAEAQNGFVSFKGHSIFFSTSQKMNTSETFAYSLAQIPETQDNSTGISGPYKKFNI